MPWVIERLSATIDVSAFECGERSLNYFLRVHALNNDRAGLGRTYIALERGEAGVAGYFTISTGSVRFDTVPDYSTKKLPKYPIPSVHIGRLAVDLSRQGKGLGETLLVDALRRAAEVSESVGIYAVDVIALHDKAKQFYLKYGFLEMLDTPLHLFLPIETARIMAGM